MKYKFEFTEEEANIILQALGEVPAKISMGLIANIQNQAQVQMGEGEQNVDNINNSNT